LKVFVALYNQDIILRNMDGVECGPIVQGGKRIMGTHGATIFRCVKNILRYILDFLHYLLTFTTSDWIIQYLTSWY